MCSNEKRKLTNTVSFNFIPQIQSYHFPVGPALSRGIFDERIQGNNFENCRWNTLSQHKYGRNPAKKVSDIVREILITYWAITSNITEHHRKRL